MSLSSWRIEKIAVIGAGIVGVPMAALLARAKIRVGTDSPARVVIIQRNSPTSGWKVAALNSGRSPIAGIEPDLDAIVSETVAERVLSADHSYEELRDADVILICVQTDKLDLGPDYGPLMESLKDLALQLQKKPAGKKPLIIFESTLAPTTMNTLIRQFFSSHGLEDGRDLLLGNSPNRVMPGRLVERVISSDKVIGGLNSITPHFIQRLYSLIVTKGSLHPTNCLTAEIVKTVENAYRDVRIAYSAEIARFCDDHDIDYYQVREDVNRQLVWSDNATASPNAVPAGGLLIPTVGVGGHCLPKDGILLLWKKIESGANMSGSLILEARRINDESPAAALRHVERLFGDLSGKSIALLGVAYRFNSEDTRNSPTFVLARYLIAKACRVHLHDPYVNPADQNLTRFKLEACFTREMEEAVESAEYILFCTAHHSYIEIWDRMIQSCPNLKGVFDGCNLFGRPIVLEKGIAFGGIAKGIKSPSRSFLDFVRDGFRAVETGFANELDGLIGFINQQFARDRFDGVDFRKVQEIAGTCVTGCQIVNPGPVEKISPYKGFLPRLVDRAINYPSSSSAVRLT